jgi:hypothetical protein
MAAEEVPTAAKSPLLGYAGESGTIAAAVTVSEYHV